MKSEKKKKSIFQWLLKNRLRVVVLLFIIVVPITLITLAYVGPYTSTRKVYFDTEDPESLVRQGDFIGSDDINELDLNIDLIEINYPTLNADDELTGGTYRFNISYSPNVSGNFSAVQATFVLQTTWYKSRSVTKSQNITTSHNALTLTYNHKLPTRTLIFINVERPMLYIKLEITRSTSDFPMTYYIKHNLNDETPLIKG